MSCCAPSETSSWLLACPDDLTPTNGFDPTDVMVRVFPAPELRARDRLQQLEPLRRFGFRAARGRPHGPLP